MAIFKKRARPEQQFQILIVEQRLKPLERQGLIVDYWSTPNELVGMLFKQHPWVATIAKKMGVRRGVTDIIIRAKVRNEPRIAFLELKSDRGSMSDEQSAFEQRTKEWGGGYHYTLRPSDDAGSLAEVDAMLEEFLA